MTKYLLASQDFAHRSSPGVPFLQVKPGTWFKSLKERDVYVFKCEEQAFWEYRFIYSEEGWQTFQGSIVASDPKCNPTPDEPPTYYQDYEIMNQLMRLSELAKEDDPDTYSKL